MGDIGTPRDDLELVDVVFHLQDRHIKDETEEILSGYPDDRSFFGDDDSIEDGFCQGAWPEQEGCGDGGPRAVPRLRLPLKREASLEAERRPPSTEPPSWSSASQAASALLSWYIGTPRDDDEEPSKKLLWSAAACAAELRRAVGANKPQVVASTLQLAAESSDPQDAGAFFDTCFGAEAPDGGGSVFRDAVAEALALAAAPRSGADHSDWREAMQRRLAICILLAQCGGECGEQATQPRERQPLLGPSPFFLDSPRADSSHRGACSVADVDDADEDPDDSIVDESSSATGRGACGSHSPRTSSSACSGLRGASPEASPPRARSAPPEELRFADDGMLYTRREFLQEWGEAEGARHWSGAVQACERRLDLGRGPCSYAGFLEQHGRDGARLRWSLAPSLPHGEAPVLMTVVGGARGGGLVVRAGSSLRSTELGERLARRAEVECLERAGTRMRYRLVRGVGPPTGWITWSMGDKRLARRSRQGEAAPARG